MSRYDDNGYDDPRSYHTVRTRRREADEPEYVREEIYTERGKGSRAEQGAMVYRGREDSIEDIDREFPPPNARDYRGYDDRGPRRARSARGGYDDYYDDDRYTEAGAAAGAGAGYAAGRRRRRRTNRDRSRSRSSEDSRRGDGDRRKSGIAEALGGLGLGGIAAAVLGKDKKDRDRDDDRSTRSRSRPAYSRSGRSYRSEGDRSRSRSRGGDSKQKWIQSAQAAVIAGAIEAFRSRKEPGPWTGEKAKRIATAAIGAGGINKLVDRNPDKSSKLHLAEGVVGGLVATRLANGARSKSRGPGGRSGSPDTFRSRSRSVVDRFRNRGRSQSRGRDGELKQGNGGGNGIKELVAGGALAAAGKAIYDRVRSKSRGAKGRDRSRSRSSSRDSYVPIRARRRDVRRRRRRSPNNNTDMIAGAGATRQIARRGTDRGLATRDTNGGNSNNNNNDRAIAAGAGGGAVGALAAANHERDGSKKSGSESSSTTAMENKRKKMKGKELITAGLATVATIHAVHGVYSSMEAHEKRHRLVAEGEMTKEEAKKKQTKAWVQDAAAIGIAALGIKGAFSEWKEMNEHRHEIHEIENRKKLRRKRLATRKRKEEAEHRERLMGLMETNPQGALLMMQQDQIRNGGYPMPMMNMYGNNGTGGRGAGIDGGGGGGGARNRSDYVPVEQSGNPYAPRAGY